MSVREGQGSALLDLRAAKFAGLGDDTAVAEEPACIAYPLQGENPFETVKVGRRTTFSAEKCAFRIHDSADSASTSDGGHNIPERVLRDAGAP